MKSNQLYQISIIALVLLLIYAFFFNENTRVVTRDVPVITVKRDTLPPIIDTVYVPKYVRLEAEPKIIFVSDTVIETRPFVATIDTVFNQTDTLHTAYYFPENRFFMDYKSREKIIEHTNYITETITKEITQPRPWYEIPIFIAGGAGAGYIIGNLKE